MRVMSQLRVLAPFFLFAALIGVSALALRSAPGAPGGQLIVCGWDELYILDLSENPPKKIWSWRAEDRPELPEAIRTKFKTIDECKPVDGGRRILITASSDGVAVIERSTGKVTFYAAVVNAHSIELLPDERVIVAASHRANAPGDRVILFDLAKSGTPLFHADLSWPHGFVWDAERQLLWAIGEKELVAYRLTGWQTPAPSLKDAFRYDLPDSGGHDLYAVPGTPLLSLTTGRHCWRFDRDRRAFVKDPDIGDRPGVKCVNTNPVTGQAVWVLSEGGNWWSDKLRFLRPENLVQLPGERIYKARWFPGPAGAPK
jgi:hypothetical protein